MTKRVLRLRNIMTGGAVVLAAGLGTAGVASAATTHATSTTTHLTVKLSKAADDLPGDPTTMTHGPGETLLTGNNLTSAVNSVQAAVPNATVVRAETDAQGATYEVHLKKSDGTYVTEKENASFAVTSTQTGYGTRSAGARDGHDGHFGPPRVGGTGAVNQ
jgi:hypothetical protein